MFRWTGPSAVAPALAWPAAAFTGTTTWIPSASGAARLTSETSARRVGSARAPDRVGDARALGEPVQPRPVDRAHNVDDELGPRLGLERLRGRSRSRLRSRSRVENVPPADQEHEAENERAGEKPPARRGEGVQHVLHPAEEPVTRGCRDCVETVSSKDVTL